jgi:hypothetical protein
MEAIGLKGSTQKIVRSRQHRYLELTIFYRTTVIAKAETLLGWKPFALQMPKLQCRSGD